MLIIQLPYSLLVTRLDRKGDETGTKSRRLKEGGTEKYGRVVNQMLRRSFMESGSLVGHSMVRD